jgi:hypothetical protein
MSALHTRIRSALQLPISSLRGLRRRRELLEPEREFLRREFADSLDLTTLRIAGGGQPIGRIAWQPMAALIQFADVCFEARDPSRPLRDVAYPVLAHEALHVWQRVHGHYALHVSVDGLWLGLSRGRAAYVYDTSLRDPAAVLSAFLAGNIEQQGQIFEDYVRSNVFQVEARDARFSHVAHYVRNKARA